MDYSAVGQTTHLAARMEQLAPPGSIRLTADTLRLAEGFIQVSALGLVPVKGLAEPVAVWELVGVTALRRRLQAAAARGLTPFVGRQPELAALHQALVQAQAGQGQVVALVGEPGVGKSRLVYEVHSLPPHAGLAGPGECLGVLRQSHAYFPVIDLLRRTARSTRAIRRDHPGQGHRPDPHPGRDLPGDAPRLAGAAGCPARGSPFWAPGSVAAASAHPGGPPARAAAGKPGAAAAAGL